MGNASDQVTDFQLRAEGAVTGLTMVSDIGRLGRNAIRGIGHSQIALHTRLQDIPHHIVFGQAGGVIGFQLRLGGFQFGLQVFQLLRADALHIDTDSAILTGHQTAIN